MKQKRLVGLLMSCLLIVSGISSVAAAAEEAVPQENAVQVETAAAEENAGDPDAADLSENDPAVSAGSVKKITICLAELSADHRSGFVYAEDGSVSYLLDGEKLSGHFTVMTDFLKGDLEGNGVVDASDASLMLTVAAASAVGETTAEELLLAQNSQIATSYQAEQLADINNDGAIDAADAAALLVYISKVGSGAQTVPLGCGQYYADENGVLRQGWFTTDEGKYYAYPDYTLAENMTEIGGKTYCFSEEALLQTGYVKYQGATYFFSKDGAMITGWLDVGGAMRYFDMQNGAQAFGVTEIDAELYYFDESGALLSGGWLKTKDGVRYADKDGILLTDWQTIGDARYYFDETGVMASGVFGIGDATYCFAADGKQLYGLQKAKDGTRYFEETTGKMLTGFIDFEDGRHYFDKNGVMASGIFSIDDVTYCFDVNGIQQFGWQKADDGTRYFEETTGKMLTGFIDFEDGRHYFDEDGVMLTDWQTIGKDQYYFDTKGIMQTGDVTIDGEVYHFRTNGIFGPVKICLDAGHYAKYNHSPVNSEYWESDFTWKIHLYLKDALEDYGFEVITTREDKDTDLPLASRGYASEGCDLFLSLHSNACGTESIDAPLACCTVTGTCDELGQLLADKVAEVMKTNQGGKIWKRQGKDGDWYSVLWGATKVGTPAILLEHSYHTNKRATAWLLVDENVQRMAEEEAKLLAEYYGMIG